jgi:hypothetical protein
MNRRRPAIIKVRRMFKTKLRMQLELMNLKNGASGVSSVDGTSVEAHSPSTAETKTPQYKVNVRHLQTVSPVYAINSRTGTIMTIERFPHTCQQRYIYDILQRRSLSMIDLREAYQDNVSDGVVKSLRDVSDQ